VTDHLQAFRILVGDDGQIDVLVDQVRGIHQLAVDLAGQRGLARPVAMLDATCATVTGPSNSRAEPSGRRTEIIVISMCGKTKSGKMRTKKRGLAAFFSF
jgi:hypothetical protein